MKRGATPSWVATDGAITRLERIPFSQKDYQERYLQEILDRNPEILPVDEFERDFGPIVSVGREINGIDNLFVSPTGHITLVETKLWRNPQATREVVAQVLDYASRLTKLSYEDFEDLCRSALVPAPLADSSLYELVATRFPEEIPPEPQFHDELSKSLRNGRFLLLIVGDGIRENLQDILRVVHSQPQLQFTFGMVALQLYSLSGIATGRLVVPQVVANSTEIVRAVVKVETSGPATVSVGLEEATDNSQDGGRRRKLSEDEFYEQVGDQATRAYIESVFERVKEMGASLEMRGSSVSLRLLDPRGSGRKFTLFVMLPTGSIYFGWLSNQLKNAGYDPLFATAYLDRLLAMFPWVKRSSKDPDNLSQQLSKEMLEPRLDEFFDALEEFITNINSAA